MHARSTRRRTEAALAILFTVAMLGGGAAVLYFVLTMSVHSDAAAVPSRSSGTPAVRDAQAVERARQLARTLVVNDNLPGLSIAVARDGEVVWAEAFGWADVEHRAAVTPLTRFRIGSVSIPLTAAAVGVLLERGQIDLDAPVQRYIAWFPAKQWPVTTRQLMAHVAGVHHGPAGANDRMPNRHCDSLADALRVFADDPLLFRPGTEYRYSVYDWILVSAIVEAAAGESFLTFINREVLAPAGMEQTVVDQQGVLPDHASFYFPRAMQRPNFGLEEAPSADYSCFAGAGAFLSTPSDLARFGAAMLKPGLLKANTLALLREPQRLESALPTGYALGWNVESVALNGETLRAFGHRGSPVGGTATLMTIPDRALAIAVTSNVSFAAGVAPFAARIAEAFSQLP